MCIALALLSATISRRRARACRSACAQTDPQGFSAQEPNEKMTNDDCRSIMAETCIRYPGVTPENGNTEDEPQTQDTQANMRTPLLTLIFVYFSSCDASVYSHSVSNM